MAYLVFHRSPTWQDYYSLDKDEMIVGRDGSCDIVLADAGVSRRHARLFQTEGSWWVADLDTKNGTSVDGERIGQTRLAFGQAIDFGGVAARFLEHCPDGSVADEVQETFVVDRRAIDGQPSRLRLLYRLAEAAGEPEDEAGFAQRVLVLIGGELVCENVYLGLTEADVRFATRGYFHSDGKNTTPFLLSRTILNKVLRERRCLLVRDVARESDLKGHRSVIDANVRSVLCAPLLAAGHVVGVLYADTRHRLRTFTDEDAAFLSTVGCVLGAFFHSTRTVIELRRRNRDLQSRLAGEELIGSSLRMVEVRETIRKYATRGDAHVLLLGENGTGKEIAARLIHRQSARVDKPFLAINCAAVPRDLFENELFGHARGAFSSANADKRGLFALAEGGVLFLDEIGEMPLELQTKLLRVVETKTFCPLGSEKMQQADVRIVAATNCDLAVAVAEGRFRQDLYQRLHVLALTLPPLRERIEDLPELCEHFLAGLRHEVATRVTGFSPAAIELMKQYPWPGNVRELRTVIQHALYMCEEDLIEPDHLARIARAPESGDEANSEWPAVPGSFAEQVEQLEKNLIEAALERYHGNRTHAAAELGLVRKTLLAKIKKYNL